MIFLLWHGVLIDQYEDTRPHQRGYLGRGSGIGPPFQMLGLQEPSTMYLRSQNSSLHTFPRATAMLALYSMVPSIGLQCSSRQSP